MFTECSMYTEVAEKRGQPCNLAKELRQEKKNEVKLALLLHYSAGTLKYRDAKARRDRYNNFTWFSASYHTIFAFLLSDHASNTHSHKGNSKKTFGMSSCIHP